MLLTHFLMQGLLSIVILIHLHYRIDFPRQGKISIDNYKQIPDSLSGDVQNRLIVNALWAIDLTFPPHCY